MTPALHFTRFGKYEIIRKLGRSLSDVYLALDPETNRRVVLKIIEHCHDSYTQLIVDAERRGATIQQQLHYTDPRILEIYDYGEQDGCFFVAMQYAEGNSLAELIRQKNRLDPKTAAQYGAELCSQLASLHSFQIDIDGQKRAVVHGDVKPSNIQIGPDGHLWLLDFGIAKAISATRNLTAHNLGSPAYCSPERLKNGEVNAHSDLWAAGVCLYEMVSGIPPYQAQTTRKLEDLIQSRRPPRALPATCPPGLRAIIWKALAADSTRRYSSATAMRDDLNAFLANKTASAERERQPSWDANATIQNNSQPHVSTSKRRARRWRIPHLSIEYELIAWSLLAGLLVGFLCFLPASMAYRYWRDSATLRARTSYSTASIADIESDWRQFTDLKHRYSWLGSLSPTNGLASSLQAHLVAAGNDVIDSYRNSTVDLPQSFNWDKARHALKHASELAPADTSLRGKLALCDGYLHLLKDPAKPQTAEPLFQDAATLLPNSPDPHLGLAHIELAGNHNIGRGAAELALAERLGYKPGPRESEEQGDAFLFRGEQALHAVKPTSPEAQRRRMLAAATRDLDRARFFYEPISGYSDVDKNLERIEKEQAVAEQLSAPPPKPQKSKHRSARNTKQRRSHRWQ